MCRIILKLRSRMEFVLTVLKSTIRERKSWPDGRNLCKQRLPRSSWTALESELLKCVSDAAALLDPFIAHFVGLRRLNARSLEQRSFSSVRGLAPGTRQFADGICFLPLEPVAMNCHDRFAR
jgi:hypothetical protein